MQPVLLFVYGTLMRGESAHSLLGSGALFVAEAHTEPQFTLVDMGEYPALLNGGATAVRGELYEIDAALLPALDRYEDVPQMYERQLIAVQGREASTYVLRAELGTGLGVIDSGSWRDR